MLSKTEYHPFYQPYIQEVNLEQSISENLQTSLNNTFNILGSLNENEAKFRYAPNKWSIKELVQHLIDTERVLSYRALAISRKEKVNLPGFDENEYIKNANTKNISITNLLKEFSLIRKSNIAMFNGFTEEILNGKGKANNAEISVKALGYIMSGHVLHHLKVITKRYLPQK